MEFGEAAIRAGYSVRTAAQTGHENLRKPDIQAAISESAKSRAERTEVSQDEVIRELHAIAISDMRDFVTWGPKGLTLKSSESLSDAVARCVVEVSETKNVAGGGTVRFKLHPKMPALEALNKHLAAEDMDARMRAIEEKLGL